MNKKENEKTTFGSIRLSSEWPDIQILYEDDTILALNKPAGLLTSPDRWDKTKANLMGLLHAAIRTGQQWCVKRNITYLANVHRLDRETSGVILLCKNKESLILLSSQFGENKPKKTYVALVEGSPPEETNIVDIPIGPHPRIEGLVAIRRSDGKKSKTEIRIRQRFRYHTLIEAVPYTGRQHQIRVHCKALGCPIVGDQDYGDGQPLMLSQLKRKYKQTGEEERPLISRTALHGEALDILHPSSGIPVRFEAPWPKDLVIALKYLRKFAA